MTHLDCPLRCEVPEGLVEVPLPRHAWSDVIVCPNTECDRRRAFLVRKADTPSHHPSPPEP